MAAGPAGPVQGCGGPFTSDVAKPDGDRAAGLTLADREGLTSGLASELGPNGDVHLEHGL